MSPHSHAPPAPQARPHAAHGRLVVCSCARRRALAEGDWEITPQSELALERGLEWLARNQGPTGNWDTNDLGLVSMGALAFLAAGHSPGHGKYGVACERALDYVLKNAQGPPVC